MIGLGKLLNVVATLLLLVVGGGLLANSFGFIDIAGLLFERELLTVTMGAVMVLLGLVVVLIGIRNMRPEQTVSIQSPEGEVRIAFSAIEELLRKASHQIDGVKELKPRVVGGKRGLEVFNRVSVGADVSIPQVTARIQEVVKSQVKGVVGIEDICAIRIYVNRIVTTEGNKKEASKDKNVQFS